MANPPSPFPISPSVSPTRLLEHTPGRRGGSVFNSSSGDIFMSLGEVVSLNRYTVRIPVNALYEFPSHGRDGVHSGEVWALWAAPATGQAIVTESH